MRHFAYPNVAQGRFLGCGRYCTLPLPQVPDTPYVPAQPDTGNLAAIRSAALRLVPEWRQEGPQARIYEQRDPSPLPYRGESLDLAYLLATIQCARPLRFETEAVEGDFWCTGALMQVEGRPFLKEVAQAGFDTKLEAFVAQGQDRIFFVPAANLGHPQHDVCRAYQVTVLSLPEFRARVRPGNAFDLHAGALVVTVEGPEVSLLVTTLFQAPETLPRAPRPWRLVRMLRRSLALSLLLLLTLISSFWWLRGLPPFHGTVPTALQIRGVVRDELLRVLEALVAQIQWTRTARSHPPTIPRRPGETRAAFEDRARDEFARGIEELLAGYQRFPLPEAVYAAQRANVAALPTQERSAMAKAYTSVAEAKEQIFLYREALQQLLQLWPEASDTRQKWADLRAEETRNALMSLWFDILGYWLLLQPEPTSLQVMQAVWLPQLLPTPASREILPAGPPGWQFTRVQRARLAQEKADLLRRQETLRSETYAAQDLKPCSSEPLTAERALEQAGHAYTEQKPQDALCFLQQILHTGTLTPEQRRYVEMSLTYLQNPEFFDGVLGVYLLKVEATGAAAKADLQPGDVIVRYNQQLVKEPAELATLIAASHDAPSVPIEFVRNGQRLTHYVPGGTSLTALGTPLVVLWGSAL